MPRASTGSSVSSRRPTVSSTPTSTWRLNGRLSGVDPSVAGRAELDRRGRGRRLRRPARAGRWAGDGGRARGGGRRRGWGEDASRPTCASRAVASSSVAVGIMAIMFWPGPPFAHGDSSTGWSCCRRRSCSSGPAAAPRAAWRAARHGERTWTRWSPSARWPLGATASVVTLAPQLVMEAGREPETYFDSRRHHHRPRPARPLARGPRQAPDGRRHPARSSGCSRARHASSADGAELDLPLEEVQVGDLVRVRPGEKVPVDGLVIEGASSRRRVDADRRVDARRQGSWRRGHRRDA